MRNRAKTNREWTKTFRFNGHDYTLSSVFDDEEHDLFDIENYVGESYLQLQKQKPLNESFLRDIDDEDIGDSEEQIQASSFTFTMYKEDGESIQIRLSEDNLLNKIMMLCSPIILIPNDMDVSYADDIVKIFSNGTIYQCFIKFVKYENGVPKFVITDKRSTDVIKFYYDSENSERVHIMFSYTCGKNNNGAITRYGKTLQMNYATFCDWIKIDKYSLQNKNMYEYYTNLSHLVLNTFNQYGVDCQLIRKNVDFDIKNNKQVVRADKSFIKNCFKMTQKYTKKTFGDLSVMDAHIQSVLPKLKSVYSNLDDVYTDDDIQDDTQFVRLLNNNHFCEILENSVWMQQVLQNGSQRYFKQVVIEEDPNYEGQIIEKVSLVIPLTMWVYMLPAIALFVVEKQY